MVILRRGGIIFLTDGNRDVIALTPMEAEWFSQEMRSLVTSEFCVQLHLAASEANSEVLAETPSIKSYPLKKGLNPS